MLGNNVKMLVYYIIAFAILKGQNPSSRIFEWENVFMSVSYIEWLKPKDLMIETCATCPHKGPNDPCLLVVTPLHTLLPHWTGLTCNFEDTWGMTVYDFQGCIIKDVFLTLFFLGRLLWRASADVWQHWRDSTERPSWGELRPPTSPGGSEPSWEWSSQPQSASWLQSPFPTLRNCWDSTCLVW